MKWHISILTIALVAACSDDDKSKKDGGPDAAVPDMAVVDLLPVIDSTRRDAPQDLKAPDIYKVDARLPDQMPQDIASVDIKSPDLYKPDSKQPDLYKPDIWPPDLPVQDMALPDMFVPDKAIPDQNFQKDYGAPLKAKWVTIKPGSFMMGSPTTEPCRGKDETLHKVTLTNKFEIQTTEVTQGQFKALMGYNPSYYKYCGPNCPVDSVNWYEAVAYCNALSAKAGKKACYSCMGSGSKINCWQATAYTQGNIFKCPGYRLPTEAEWEYAYRAGTSTAFYNGKITNCKSADANAGAIGWYCANAKTSYPGCTPGGAGYSCGYFCIGTQPVGMKKPNAWGLYDMAGNLYEWCNDWYHQSYGSNPVKDPWGIPSGGIRLLRGGHDVSDPYELRAAYRHGGSPKGWGTTTFRCVRTVLP